MVRSTITHMGHPGITAYCAGRNAQNANGRLATYLLCALHVTHWTVDLLVANSGLHQGAAFRRSARSAPALLRPTLDGISRRLPPWIPPVDSPGVVTARPEQRRGPFAARTATVTHVSVDDHGAIARDCREMRW